MLRVRFSNTRTSHSLVLMRPVHSLTLTLLDAVAKDDRGKTGHGGLASISGSSKRDYHGANLTAGESDDGHHIGGVDVADNEPY